MTADNEAFTRIDIDALSRFDRLKLERTKAAHFHLLVQCQSLSYLVKERGNKGRGFAAFQVVAISDDGCDGLQCRFGHNYSPPPFLY